MTETQNETPGPYTEDQHNRPQLVLIIGGARSGKSTFAERLARQSGRSVAYIATAMAGDDDMRDRIRRHQAARPASWETIEEPLDLVAAVCQAAQVADVILVDCLTIWLSNWLFSQEVDESSDDTDSFRISSQHYEATLVEIQRFLTAAEQLGSDKTLMVVSNEVGLGIVPAYALGRVYRDVLGLVNQRVAQAASRVYFMIAGLGVDIKRLHEDARI